MTYKVKKQVSKQTETKQNKTSGAGLGLGLGWWLNNSKRKKED